MMGQKPTVWGAVKRANGGNVGYKTIQNQELSQIERKMKFNKVMPLNG